MAHALPEFSRTRWLAFFAELTAKLTHHNVLIVIEGCEILKRLLVAQISVAAVLQEGELLYNIIDTLIGSVQNERFVEPAVISLNEELIFAQLETLSVVVELMSRLYRDGEPYYRLLVQARRGLIIDGLLHVLQRAHPHVYGIVAHLLDCLLRIGPLIALDGQPYRCKHRSKHAATEARRDRSHGSLASSQPPRVYPKEAVSARGNTDRSRSSDDGIGHGKRGQDTHGNANLCIGRSSMHRDDDYCACLYRDGVIYVRLAHSCGVVLSLPPHLPLAPQMALRDHVAKLCQQVSHQSQLMLAVVDRLTALVGCSEGPSRRVVLSLRARAMEHVHEQSRAAIRISDPCPCQDASNDTHAVCSPRIGNDWSATPLVGTGWERRSCAEDECSLYHSPCSSYSSTGSSSSSSSSSTTSESGWDDGRGRKSAGRAGHASAQTESGAYRCHAHTAAASVNTPTQSWTHRHAEVVDPDGDRVDEADQDRLTSNANTANSNAVGSNDDTSKGEHANSKEEDVRSTEALCALIDRTLTALGTARSHDELLRGMSDVWCLTVAHPDSMSAVVSAAHIQNSLSRFLNTAPATRADRVVFGAVLRWLGYCMMQTANLSSSERSMDCDGDGHEKEDAATQGEAPDDGHVRVARSNHASSAINALHSTVTLLPATCDAIWQGPCVALLDMLRQDTTRADADMERAAGRHTPATATTASSPLSCMWLPQHSPSLTRRAVQSIAVPLWSFLIQATLPMTRISGRRNSPSSPCSRTGVYTHVLQNKRWLVDVTRALTRVVCTPHTRTHSAMLGEGQDSSSAATVSARAWVMMLDDAVYLDWAMRVGQSEEGVIAYMACVLLTRVLSSGALYWKIRRRCNRDDTSMKNWLDGLRGVASLMPLLVGVAIQNPPPRIRRHNEEEVEAADCHTGVSDERTTSASALHYDSRTLGVAALVALDHCLAFLGTASVVLGPNKTANTIAVERTTSSSGGTHNVAHSAHSVLDEMAHATTAVWGEFTTLRRCTRWAAHTPLRGFVYRVLCHSCHTRKDVARLCRTAPSALHSAMVCVAHETHAPAVAAAAMWLTRVLRVTRREGMTGLVGKDDDFFTQDTHNSDERDGCAGPLLSSSFTRCVFVRAANLTRTRAARMRHMGCVVALWQLYVRLAEQTAVRARRTPFDRCEGCADRNSSCTHSRRDTKDEHDDGARKEQEHRDGSRYRSRDDATTAHEMRSLRKHDHVDDEDVSSTRRSGPRQTDRGAENDKVMEDDDDEATSWSMVWTPQGREASLRVWHRLMRLVIHAHEVGWSSLHHTSHTLSSTQGEHGPCARSRRSRSSLKPKEQGNGRNAMQGTQACMAQWYALTGCVARGLSLLWRYSEHTRGGRSNLFSGAVLAHFFTAVMAHPPTCVASSSARGDCGIGKGGSSSSSRRTIQSIGSDGRIVLSSYTVMMQEMAVLAHVCLTATATLATPTSCALAARTLLLHPCCFWSRACARVADAALPVGSRRAVALCMAAVLLASPSPGSTSGVRRGVQERTGDCADGNHTVDERNETCKYKAMLNGYATTILDAVMSLWRGRPVSSARRSSSASGGRSLPHDTRSTLGREISSWYMSQSMTDDVQATNDMGSDVEADLADDDDDDVDYEDDDDETARNWRRAAMLGLRSLPCWLIYHTPAGNAWARQSGWLGERLTELERVMKITRDYLRGGGASSHANWLDAPMGREGKESSMATRVAMLTALQVALSNVVSVVGSVHCSSTSTCTLTSVQKMDEKDVQGHCGMDQDARCGDTVHTNDMKENARCEDHAYCTGHDAKKTMRCDNGDDRKGNSNHSNTKSSQRDTAKGDDCPHDALPAAMAQRIAAVLCDGVSAPATRQTTLQALRLCAHSAAGRRCLLHEIHPAGTGESLSRSCLGRVLACVLDIPTVWRRSAERGWSLARSPSAFGHSPTMSSHASPAAPAATPLSGASIETGWEVLTILCARGGSGVARFILRHRGVERVMEMTTYILRNSQDRRSSNNGHPPAFGNRASDDAVWVSLLPPLRLLAALSLDTEAQGVMSRHETLVGHVLNWATVRCIIPQPSSPSPSPWPCSVYSSASATVSTVALLVLRNLCFLARRKTAMCQNRRVLQTLWSAVTMTSSSTDASLSVHSSLLSSASIDNSMEGEAETVGPLLAAVQSVAQKARQQHNQLQGRMSALHLQDVHYSQADTVGKGICVRSDDMGNDEAASPRAKEEAEQTWRRRRQTRGACQDENGLEEVGRGVPDPEQNGVRYMCLRQHIAVSALAALLHEHHRGAVYIRALLTGEKH